MGGLASTKRWCQRGPSLFAPPAQLTNFELQTADGVPIADLDVDSIGGLRELTMATVLLIAIHELDTGDAVSNSLRRQAVADRPRAIAVMTQDDSRQAYNTPCPGEAR